MAKNAHREAQREKREATKAICVTQSGEARSPALTPVAATVSNGASVANRNDEPEVPSTRDSSAVVGAAVIFVGGFDSKQLAAAARRKGMVVRKRTHSVAYVVGSPEVQTKLVQLTLHVGARRLSVAAFKALLATAPDIDAVQSASDHDADDDMDPASDLPDDDVDIAGGLGCGPVDHSGGGSNGGGGATGGYNDIQASNTTVSPTCHSCHFKPGVFASTRAAIRKRATTFDKK